MSHTSLKWLRGSGHGVEHLHGSGPTLTEAGRECWKYKRRACPPDGVEQNLGSFLSQNSFLVLILSLFVGTNTAVGKTEAERWPAVGRSTHNQAETDRVRTGSLGEGTDGNTFFAGAKEVFFFVFCVKQTPRSW